MTLAQSNEQASMGDGDDEADTSLIVLDSWMVALDDESNVAQRSLQLTDTKDALVFQRYFVYIFCLLEVYFMMSLITKGNVQVTEVCVEEWPNNLITN